MILESSQPLGAPRVPFLRSFLILNVNYMPTNGLRGIFHTHFSGQPLKEVYQEVTGEMKRNDGKSCHKDLTAAKNNTWQDQNETDFLSAK